MKFWERIVRYGNMGCSSGEGLSFGTTIPVPCGVIHLIVHTQNNGSNFSPILNQRSVKQRPVWIYYYSNWPIFSTEAD